MKHLKYFMPFAIEITTKSISFVTSLILILSLSTSEFGEFSYVRSFVLVLSTFFLFGLQTSSFKFANYSSKLSIEYLTFAVLSIIALGVAVSLALAFTGEFIFFKFEYALDDWIKFLILPNMLTFFFVAYYKAIGKPILGFMLSFIGAISLFSMLLILILAESFDIEFALNALLVSSVLTCTTSMLIIFKSFFSVQFNHKIWPIKDWCSISLSMWLSGFLPLFLLQGLMLIFGLFFDSMQLGVISIAVVIVANLATFKEIGISLYLPKLVGHFNKTRLVDKSLLLKCVSVGVIPIIGFIILSLLFEKTIIRHFSPKISGNFFSYLYILALSQLLMAIYQPIWRLMSAIGYHSRILRISLSLLLFLIGFYVYFGYTQQPTFMIGSSMLISFCSLVFGVFLLQKEIKIKS